MKNKIKKKKKNVFTVVPLVSFPFTVKTLPVIPFPYMENARRDANCIPIKNKFRTFRCLPKRKPPNKNRSNRGWRPLLPPFPSLLTQDSNTYLCNGLFERLNTIQLRIDLESPWIPPALMFIFNCLTFFFFLFFFFFFTDPLTTWFWNVWNLLSSKRSQEWLSLFQKWATTFQFQRGETFCYRGSTNYRNKSQSFHNWQFCRIERIKRPF